MRITDTRLREPELSPAGSMRKNLTPCVRLCGSNTLNHSGVCWPCQDRDKEQADGQDR